MRRVPALHPQRRGACYGESACSAEKLLPSTFLTLKVSASASSKQRTLMAAISQADLIAHLPALTAAGIGLRHGCTSVSCLSGFQHSTLGLSSSPSSRRAPTYRPFGGRVRSGSRPGPAIDRLLKPGAAFATVRTLARVDVAGRKG